MDQPLPELTQEELDNEVASWGQSTWEAKDRCEAEWRAEGNAVAWIDPKPSHLDAAACFAYAFDCKDPDHACIRIMRFVLAGGGQIRVQEKFLAPEQRDWHSIGSDFGYGQRLLVRAQTPSGLVTTRGRLECAGGEMRMAAVLLPARHQDIADRAAQTFRAILDDSGWPRQQNFLALLDGSAGCAFCGRPLRDKVSKLIGIGPDCAGRNKIAYNIGAANAVLERRRTLLEGLTPSDGNLLPRPGSSSRRQRP